MLLPTLKFLCIVALLVCLTVALPAPAEPKEEAAEGLAQSETGYYGGWGRRKCIDCDDQWGNE